MSYYPPPPPPNPTKDTIDNNVKLILEDLNDFNKKYTKYIDCSNNYNSSNCSLVDTSYNTIYTSYRNLVQMSNNGSVIGGDVSGIVVQLFENVPTIPHEIFDASHQYLMNMYTNNVVPTRQELDKKMNEYINVNDSVYNDYKTKYDLTVYTYLIWSVLATSILYYTFMKMND
jgi:hypothetical protein